MRYLTVIEVLALHGQVIEQSGGKDGIRDLGLLESAIAQPMMTFSGIDLSTGQKFNGVEESLGIEMDVKDDMTKVIKAKTKNALR
ncbi:MAG: hypothetical protein ACK6BN_16895 [Pseudanabaena sp.]